QRVLVLAKKGEDPNQVAQQMGKGGAPAAKAPAVPPPPAATSAHAAGSNGQEAPHQQQPQAAQAPVAATAAAQAPGGRVKSTPLARKVAKEAGVDVAQVPGSGPEGRVIRADVENFLKAKPAAAQAAPAGKPAA